MSARATASTPKSGSSVSTIPDASVVHRSSEWREAGINLAKKTLVIGGQAAAGVAVAIAGAAAVNAVGTGALAGLATGVMAVTASAAVTAAGVALNSIVGTTEVPALLLPPPLVAAYITAQKTSSGVLQALGTISGASAAVLPATVGVFIAIKKIDAKTAEEAALIIVGALFTATVASGSLAAEAAVATAGQVTRLAALATGFAATTAACIKMAGRWFPSPSIPFWH